MTGPARLDLLIPPVDSRTRPTQAAVDFADLVAPSHPTGEQAPRRPPISQSGSQPGQAMAVRSETGSRQASSDVSDLKRTEPLVATPPDTADASLHVERLYAAHLLAGHYLSFATSPGLRAGTGTSPEPGTSSGDAPETVVASVNQDNPVASTDPAVVQTNSVAILGEGQGGIARSGASTEETPAAPGEPGHAEAGIAEAAREQAPWLEQLVRVSVAENGQVTAWLRDFRATHSELGNRLAELRREARANGLDIGTFVVNGRSWTQNDDREKGG